MPLRPTVARALPLAICLAGGSAWAQALPAPVVPPPTITVGGAAGAAARPVTLEDIVGVREIPEINLSPDGGLAALVIRQAFLTCNCYRDALYVVSVRHRQPPRKLIEEETLSNVRWSPDGRYITYLSQRTGARQLWRIAPEGGTPQLFLAHAPGGGQNLYEALSTTRSISRVGVERYEWSPDGRKVAFTVRPAVRDSALSRLTDGGILYDDDRMWTLDILRNEWASAPVELWTHDVHTHRSTRAYVAPSAGANSRSLGIFSFAWAPDSRQLALSVATGVSVAAGHVDYDVGLLDLSTRSFESLVTTDSTTEFGPVWSRDGTRVAFMATSGDAQSQRAASLVLFDIRTRSARVIEPTIGESRVTRLWWGVDDEALMYETPVPAGARLERGGLYRVELAGGRPRRVTPEHDHVSRCSDLASHWIACVRQRPDLPPAPVAIDLLTGEQRPLMDVNPDIAGVELSPVTEMRWSDRFGVESNGYLIKPLHYRSGQRYPLVMILYGFEGRFVTAAEWLSSYPAQALAREGMAVLLWNPPSQYDWNPDDLISSSRVWRERPMLSLRSAIALLSAQGLVDTTRLGIMGWSYGGYIAQLALTDLQVFRAASIGNGGGYSMGAYWVFGSRGHRVFYEKLYGGPPYGSTLLNWLTLTPLGSVGRIQAPVLIEAQADEAINMLELYTALRRHRVPTEFVIYPDEAHVFVQPRHRLASMRRNLEWFSFWLLGKEGTGPRDDGQYARWRRLRHQLSPLQPSIRSPATGK